MIAALDVHKKYAEVIALSGVSISVGAHQAFGLVGPNGAGKSSLLRIRCGVSRPDGGAARASLQRVEYRLVAGRLERRAWPLVDGAAAYPPAVLLTGITALDLRFNSAGRWQDRWDPATSDSLPAAVAIDITATGLPPLHQAFLVAPGAVR